jgi:hypothetical protein
MLAAAVAAVAVAAAAPPVPTISLRQADARLVAPTPPAFGDISVAGLGDVDGDGGADIGVTPAGLTPGAYILLGPIERGASGAPAATASGSAPAARSQSRPPAT